MTASFFAVSFREPGTKKEVASYETTSRILNQLRTLRSFDFAGTKATCANVH